MIIWWLFDHYLMIIWFIWSENIVHIIWHYLMFICYLFDDYLMIIGSESEPLTQFRQAMLSQNTSGEACTRRKGDLGFVGFIAARWSLWFLMSAVTIIRMQGCELDITVFAFEAKESLGLLALRLTFFDGALAASTMATDQFEQDVLHSVSEHDCLLYK